MFFVYYCTVGDWGFFGNEPPLAYPVQKSHSRINFQMKPPLGWTVFWFANSSVNKANPEKIWTTTWIFWISMAHIKAYFPTIRPYNNNKDSKIDLSLRRQRIIHENNHAWNKRFQLPLILTANQILRHCSTSQSALRPKSGSSEQKRERVCIRPNFSGSRQRECMRTAKIGPDLRLVF